MAYIQNNDGSRMSIVGGTNPVAPSAADIARLRGAVADMGRTIPEVSGYLSQITNLQRNIGLLLGDRESAMFYLSQQVRQYALMKEGTDSQEAAGLPIDTTAADAWAEGAARPFQHAVELIDQKILALQVQQREFFDMACRYIPSFS